MTDLRCIVATYVTRSCMNTEAAIKKILISFFRRKIGETPIQSTLSNRFISLTNISCKFAESCFPPLQHW